MKIGLPQRTQRARRKKPLPQSTQRAQSEIGKQAQAEAEKSGIYSQIKFLISPRLRASAVKKLRLYFSLNICLIEQLVGWFLMSRFPDDRMSRSHAAQSSAPTLLSPTPNS